MTAEGRLFCGKRRLLNGDAPLAKGENQKYFESLLIKIVSGLGKSANTPSILLIGPTTICGLIIMKITSSARIARQLRYQ